MNAPSEKKPESPVNRRDFLKKTSAAVAGASVLGGLSVERSAFAAGSDTLKLALIGCGGRGSGAADQGLKTEGSVKPVAMADVFKSDLEGSLRKLRQRKKEKGDVPADHQFIGF